MCGRCSLPSVEGVHETLQDTNLAQFLNAQLIIMAGNFAANKELQYKACAQYFANLNLPFAIKTRHKEKLSKYMTDGQPPIKFLKEAKQCSELYHLEWWIMMCSGKAYMRDYLHSGFLQI
ncbi:Single-stranded DNA-binding protein [Labeo rohita]|uniref:Single-stranded DNA-binding protein n=1 Tax=Labeo rohita TaxID=84645 RepID=A0ABQ8L2D1_LABRO|nr:Single-stranded DNA-binding protein [Labeo rohita]